MGLTKVSAVLIVSLLLSACGTKESEGGRTDQLYLSAEAGVQSNLYARVRIKLQYQDMFSDYINLSGNEYLRIYYNDRLVELTKDGDFFGTGYEASFDTGGNGGEFRLVLHRYNDEHHEFSVRIPKPFEITSPRSSQVIYGNEQVMIDWQQPSSFSGVQVQLDGALKCTSKESDGSLDIDNEHEYWEFLDSGSVIFPITKLVSNLKREVLFEGGSH